MEREGINTVSLNSRRSIIKCSEVQCAFRSDSPFCALWKTISTSVCYSAQFSIQYSTIYMYTVCNFKYIFIIFSLIRVYVFNSILLTGNCCLTLALALQKHHSNQAVTMQRSTWKLRVLMPVIDVWSFVNRRLFSTSSKTFSSVWPHIYAVIFIDFRREILILYTVQ